MKDGEILEIVECHLAKNCTIKFKEGIYIYNISYSNILKKSVKNPYHPRIFGVGFMGVGEYVSSINKKKTIYYEKWMDILKRCYRPKRVKKQITYKDVERHLWCKERDEKALKFVETNPDDLFVVYAGVYGSYWGSNRSGYSSSIIFAGKYTTQEAYEIVRGSEYGRQETVRLLNVEEFNTNIDTEVEKLQKQIDRLITYKVSHETK